MLALRAILLPLKGAAYLWEIAAGWWIGKRRGWTPDSRDYGGVPGYEIKHGRRKHWWNGRSRVPIKES